MWRTPTPSRKQVQAGHVPARRSRSYRPHCAPLEDRYLLSVTLKAGEPAVPLVGSPVTWTATAGGHGAAPVYQFSVAPAGGPFQVVRDFSPGNTYTWDPLQEGSYTVRVTVKDGYGATAGETASATYTANTRVVGTGASVSPTSNPLVALYSVPPSPGGSVRVQYRPLGSGTPWHDTGSQAIVPGKSTNVLVGGLLPSTTYLIRHVLADGTTTAPLTFTTGALPKDVTFPTFSVPQAPAAGTDPSQDLVVHFGITTQAGTANTLATDLAGNVVWYFDPVANRFPSYGASLVPGGTVLLLGGKMMSGGYADTLREVDLAGDTLRETNVEAVNAELAALGQHPITFFNHDALRLPNGDTAVLGTSPRTVVLKGTPTQYNGDMIIVLDKNFQVSWVWDPFKWLDTNRLPTQGEGPEDWMHANAIAWSPADGNLLISMRSQDWVAKIDYAGGAGDGHVVWRLGRGGDFTINSSDPSPWFTHQHDARYIDDSTLVVFDNGNTRHSENPLANSRGQELTLNEQTKQATLVVNADLGEYAYAVGSAQKLPDGNLVFTSGFTEKTIEVLPDGTKAYVLKMDMPGVEYRSYIYHNLQGDPAGSVEPAPPVPTSLSVFRPSNGQWFTTPLGGPVVTYGRPWGVAGDIPARADVDGDGLTDLAVFRPSTGQWHVTSGNGQVLTYGQQWGLPGDVPLTGDFNGDGKADLAVYRPSNGQWFIRTLDGQVLAYGAQWGLPGDVPEVGDFNGDGQTDLAVFRPSNGQWFIRTLGGQVLAYGAQWGQSGDIPEPADFDGDGKTDLGVFRPSTNQWFIASLGGPVLAYGVSWGLPGDIPSAGDFNGDGRADMAVFRPSTGSWYVASVGGPVVAYGQQWGLQGDIPTTATASQIAQQAVGAGATPTQGSPQSSAATASRVTPARNPAAPGPGSLGRVVARQARLNRRAGATPRV